VEADDPEGLNLVRVRRGAGVKLMAGTLSVFGSKKSL